MGRWVVLGIVLDGVRRGPYYAGYAVSGSNHPRRRRMKVQAAICWEPARPLEIDDDRSRRAEGGRVPRAARRDAASATPTPTRMSGRDPSGLFPAVLGHEGAGVVEEVGPGVTSLAVGDHVIPLYIPECRNCKFCLSRQDEPLRRAPRDAGQGPDARRHEPALAPRAGRCTTTWARRPSREYTVVPEIALAKIRKDAPLDKVCLLGCGVTTGIGAVLNTAKVEPGSTRRGLRPRRHRALGRSRAR